ncbi:aminoglycoside 3'-phosphotransferase [Mycolicibacterium sp. P1-18]|uniref:phosphotransferase n=1 Tax=Mycolicibacterium sp. P1-18 TaxID=2024615 RepID=UPI0011F17668|nr:phosphotransferase [Mycolicibacterium sp. P1-18]KAA0100013.1 aminoglycoside 3'-phosphotransferase [Mycolicibacterium sp. P1-18]
MSFPTESIAVPDAVLRIADGRPVAPVWVNELGGVTFSVAGDAFVKVHPNDHAALLEAEAARLRWAVGFAAVPRVLSVGPGWLHTAALPGRSAVDPHWAGRPVEAARAIGSGLRRLHDALPVQDCPFGRPSWVPDDAPAPDRLVVCQGDACAPNSLIGDDGRCSGHVDLGDLGVADRWADLAVATMSLAWNFGASHEAELLAAYGVTPDHDRIAYYRERWAE